MSKEKTTEVIEASADNPAAGEAELERAGVVWDDTKMSTHFANVVNIQSTQEQVDLFFGTNQTWDVSGSGRQVKVELTNRIIMGPHAAKRFMMALTGVVKEYEARHGTIRIGAGE